MGEGYVQFLIIAFFVIITLMDGAKRKKRQDARRSGQVPRPSGLSKTDDEEQLGEGSSAQMLPGELWKEMVTLAQGGVPTGRTEPLPPPYAESSGPTLTESDRPSTTPEHEPESDSPMSTWSSYGNFPVEIQPVPPVQARPPLSEVPSEHVMHPEDRAIDSFEVMPRELTEGPVSGETTSRFALLRRAIVMAEVLKPPVSLKQEGREPLG